jgi:hypothetical protein
LGFWTSKVATEHDQGPWMMLHLRETMNSMQLSACCITETCKRTFTDPCAFVWDAMVVVGGALGLSRGRWESCLVIAIVYIYIDKYMQTYISIHLSESIIGIPCGSSMFFLRKQKMTAHVVRIAWPKIGCWQWAIPQNRHFNQENDDIPKVDIGFSIGTWDFGKKTILHWLHPDYIYKIMCVYLHVYVCMYEYIYKHSMYIYKYINAHIYIYLF